MVFPQEHFLSESVKCSFVKTDGQSQDLLTREKPSLKTLTTSGVARLFLFK
jgi:hypothetical protein